MAWQVDCQDKTDGVGAQKNSRGIAGKISDRMNRIFRILILFDFVNSV
jgi:hypothetical protein